MNQTDFQGPRTVPDGGLAGPPVEKSMRAFVADRLSDRRGQAMARVPAAWRRRGAIAAAPRRLPHNEEANIA